MFRIKALHIITRLERGGSSDAVLLTLLELDKNQYDLSLAHGPTSYPNEQLMKQAEKAGIRFYYIRDLVRAINPIKDLKGLFRLFCLIRAEKFDIIHTHTSKAGLLGRLAASYACSAKERPIIVHTPHGHIFYGYYGPLLTKFFLLVERLMSRSTDKIVALTPQGIEEYVQFKIADRERLFDIPDGVPLEEVQEFGAGVERMKDTSQREKIKRELNLPEGDLLVGTAGRLVPVKGYKYLIEALHHLLRQIPNVTFLILGDGPLRNDLEQLADNLGLSKKIIFLGWRSDVSRILSILDLFVISSLNEGMGRVLVEAMALGKPIVATRVGGIPSVVADGESGLLVPSRDSMGLAEAMGKLLNSPERAREMGEEGRKRVPLFSAKTMVERTEQLYKELLRERHK